MRVVMLSWRDADNPEAGGAERYLHRVAAGLADRGHDVTIVTARYPGSADRDTDGAVRIRRRGGKLTVYLAGSLALASRRLGPVDVVVDVQNGVPFFSRLATQAPVVVLVHHVHREQWPVVYGRSAASLGWWLESRLAPRIYRSSPYVTVSAHTRDELIRLGVDAERVTVVHNGTDPRPASHLKPSPSPRLVCLGRLVPHKQVEHAIVLMSRLRLSHPGIHLDVIGDGWWRDQLLALREQHGLREEVTFHGYVSEEVKHDLLSQAWVNVLPSLKEGWGLSVVEAATHGVPTVGYGHAGGLADSVVDGHTGLLAADQAELESHVRSLLGDPDLRRTMGGRARDRAEMYTWEETTRQFEKLLQDAASKPTGGSRRDR
jgi:glycosyltransferase involved in cell wall biosynthesis